MQSHIVTDARNSHHITPLFIFYSLPMSPRTIPGSQLLCRIYLLLQLLKRAVFSAWRNKNAVAYPSNLWFLFNQFDKEEIGDEQILYLDSHVNARKRSCAKAKERLRRSRCAQTSTREALFKGVLTHSKFGYYMTYSFYLFPFRFPLYSHVGPSFFLFQTVCSNFASSSAEEPNSNIQCT